jgi:hypothetical protein
MALHHKEDAMKMRCDKRPAEGAFTIGSDYHLKFKNEAGGGYLVKDDKGVERTIANSICFLPVSASGKVSRPAKTIPRGTSYIPVPKKKGNDDDE